MARPDAGFDLAIVGAGLLGLATAQTLSERHPKLRLVVLEKEPRPAYHQSGHNSGVVHAGLYYLPGSLKAKLCREGGALLRERCAEWRVPIATRGKLVIAVDESELPRLDELARRGRANGIDEIHVLESSEIPNVEPAARGVRALHIPETAVVDYRAVASKLAEEVIRRGGEIRLNSQVRAITSAEGAVRITTRNGVVTASGLVACAGLQADRVASLAGAAPKIRIVPFRGGYWLVRGASGDLVRGLIYPVPDPSFPFLGVHFTRGIDGRVTAGPNAVPALARESYRRFAFSVPDAVSALTWPGLFKLAHTYARTGAREIWRDTLKSASLAEMRRYLPALAAGDVARAGCGIRAQAMTRDGSLVDDFVIEEAGASIHVLNAPSPAATSSLAIGRLVADRAAERFGL